MLDRIHPEPRPAPPPVSKPGETVDKSPIDSALKPSTSSGSFVIQLPKDQIYRIPPPENAYHFKFHGRSAALHQHNIYRGCLAISSFIVFILLMSFAAAVGIIYLILSPKLPSFSIESLSIQNLSLTSVASSPEISLIVRSENSNKIIEIDYLDGGTVAADFSGEVIFRGSWPAFYQGKKNVTVVQTVLKGSGILLSEALKSTLTASVNRREVPLAISANVPVRLRVGAIWIRTITVKLRCYVTVDKLTADLRILNKSCKVNSGVF